MASCFPPSGENHLSCSSQKILEVTILASEWGSSKGGLSTINRELAIQLAKWPEVQITLFMPQCSEEDERAAHNHKIRIVKATRRAGYDELEWLSFPPDHLKIDVIVGHGVKLGRQAQVIRESHNCKWVQVVHTDPEELGMFKSYQNPISTGEKKHKAEVELCEMADFVLGVGPKLSEAFRSYLRWCKKDQTILDITPGVFQEFVDMEHVANERKRCSVLVFGRGDAEDFQLKGFDIASSAVTELDNACLIFVGAPEGKHEQIEERFAKCGVPKSRLRIRSFLDCRESLRRLFYEVDLILMPSRTEGFGLTGLEALSAGVPVLVSSNSGFGEALSQTPFGSSFVVKSEDPKVWAEEIRKICTKDRQQRLQEAKVLRTCYEGKYSWSNQSKFLADRMVTLCHAASSHSAVSATCQATQTMDFTSEKLHTEHSRYEGQANVISGTCHSKVSVEISSFESDITFFAKRHDPDTRQWFFDDFNAWFRDPGDSRAYVLLGDPGVGKSVIAGVLAQRMRETGQLGAAYFCRHDDGTRNDPRYLLGTVAHQLCACNDKYKEIVGGEDGVKMLLGNPKLGVRELFTKLLHEPLGKSRPCHQKLLVIIDALDETDYESREDFLDLIQHRFPLLPEWLVFFVTSRPEDFVRSRLKRYNPCIKICAGTSEQQNFYQQHKQDIQNFLKKRIGSCVTISVDDVSQKCDGLFLYAHYIVKELEDAIVSGKEISNLNNLFPGNIEEFFRKNFRRVYDIVGENIFKKLFGCAIVAPSPLPISVIPFILTKENSKLDKQQVIDAVSQFLVLRTPNLTLSFLHNLVPAWLTNDTKAPPKLFISNKTAGEYLKKIVVEILSSIVQESSSPCTSVDAKLEDYVIRVAVCFLCHFGGKDWLELVFTCLTNYHFVERRLRSGKIEIYRLPQDLKRVSGCLDGDDKKKQDLLQEVAQVLLSNTFVLAECPQLLHSCLRKASNAVQETFPLNKLSVPWLDCTVFTLPDPAIAYMNCFATSSGERRIVGAAGRTLLFFDARTARRVNGPFEISKRIIDNISHLEYSPDNHFIFFGRLDKWFSVKRECIEDFPQFDGNATVYRWGFLTRDGESIVVKRNVKNFVCHRSQNTCLCNLLALWAVKEIEVSRDDVMSLHEELGVEGPIKCLLKCLSYKTYPADTHVEPKCLLGGCHFCHKLSSLIVEGYQDASLTAVRQKILEIYPFIFQCQIWDLEMGRPVLERAFLRNVQLEPFTYICHVSYFVNRWAMEIACSDFSVCNIAIITAIRYLEGSLGHRLQFEPPIDLKPAVIPHFKAERTVKVEELQEDLLERNMVLGLTQELRRKVNVNLETVLKRIKELDDAGNLQKQRDLEQEKELEHNLIDKLKSRLILVMKMQKKLNVELTLLQRRQEEEEELEMWQESILKEMMALKKKERMKLQRTGGLELEWDLKDERDKLRRRLILVMKVQERLNAEPTQVQRHVGKEKEKEEGLKMFKESIFIEMIALEERQRRELERKSRLQLECDLKKKLHRRLKLVRKMQVGLYAEQTQVGIYVGKEEEEELELWQESILKEMMALEEKQRMRLEWACGLELECDLKDERDKLRPRLLLVMTMQEGLNAELTQVQRHVGKEEEEEEEEEEELEMLKESILKEIMALEEKQRMKLERTSGLDLECDLKDEIVFLLRSKRVLNLDMVFIRECMAQHLEPKLKEELEMLIERERVPEHELIGRNRGLAIDQQELNLKQGLKLPVDQVHKLQKKLLFLEELERNLEGHRGEELDQEDSNLKQKLEFLPELERGSRHEMEYRDYQLLKFVIDQEPRWKGQLQEHEEGPIAFLHKRNRELKKLGSSNHERELTIMEYKWVREQFNKFKQVNPTTEEELESLFTKEQELYDHEVARDGLIGESKKKLETLKERKQKLIHEMEMELNRKRDHDVEGAQCLTAWMENELMPKSRENLMMKKYRKLRLNLLARKLKKQLEQMLKHEWYRSRELSYSWTRLEYEGIGVWEPYLRVLKEEKMEIDPYLVREFQHGSFECEDCTNFPEWLHDVESIVNEHILICHSPGGKWVLEADGFRNKHILRKRNRELSCDHETPQRDIEKFTRFSFTKDDSYFVYLTNNGLLHALSLETGAVLTSVPNNHIIYFTRQVPHACGYFFCSDTEEKAILLSDLFSPFKFIPASPAELAVVEKTIAAVFNSTNTVLAVCSDLKVSFWQTPEAKDGFNFISQFLLDTPGLQVKNCALSPNGQHIAIHQGSKLMLYTFTDFSLAETDTVFTEEFGYTVSSLTFSGDSASLLLCIQAFRSFTRGDVWNVVRKSVSSSVKSQNLVAVECCCLSTDKQEVILCGQYQIEIWKYGESSGHLLTTIHVEEIYHLVRFSRCIVSSDNQQLVCCIANTILIYRRNAPNVNSSRRVLHGHLGKIEFCQFLKENRYLISYGIDGMVFLWDTSGQEDKCKAVGFTKIPLDTVVCMAVSPDEEKIVCYSSTNLMCLVKLCELKSPSH